MRVFNQGIVLLLLVNLISCSSLRVAENAEQWLYAAEERNRTLLAQYAPVFVVSDPGQAYNRIGKAKVRYEAGVEKVFVDPGQSSIYTQIQPWDSALHKYRNLIYRVHFSEVPYSIMPFHLGAGKNPGLLVVLTIDETAAPVLLTTAHTCGCYLTILPFSRLSEDSYPQQWNTREQWVYGVTLPGMLKQLQPDLGEQLFIQLEPGTHRVVNIEVRNVQAEQKRHRETMEILPMDQLWNLPSDQGPVSFFEIEGARKGHVKGSCKPLERFFMSWWAFDWHVGEDKAYGPAEETGTVFYTSLKFWRRDVSDMWFFDRFLKYWGWNL
jgi:hypothetical protein